MNATMNPACNNLDARGASEYAVHLSEAQIDDQLLGDLSGYAAAHLAGCEHCAARVDAAAEPIVDFREVAMAWSERRSATMPLPVAPRDGLMWQRRMGWVTAAFAVALGISIVGSGSGNRNGHGAGVETASVEPEQILEAPMASQPQMAAEPRVIAVEAVQSNSADHISGDNRMLQAIDTELDAAVETPATLGLEPAADQSGNEGSQTSLED